MQIIKCQNTNSDFPNDYWCLLIPESIQASICNVCFTCCDHLVCNLGQTNEKSLTVILSLTANFPVSQNIIKFSYTCVNQIWNKFHMWLKKYMQYIQQTPYKNSENTPRSICKSQDIFLSPVFSAIYKHRLSSIKIQE